MNTNHSEAVVVGRKKSDSKYRVVDKRNAKIVKIERPIPFRLRADLCNYYGLYAVWD